MIVRHIGLLLLFLSFIFPVFADNNNESTLTTQNTTKTESNTINHDPLENYNRNAYRMNSTIDKNIIRPTTVGYVDYVPSPIRSALQNFFNNLRDFVSLGNDILQLDGMNTMHNFMRISINSTFGLLGIIDISSNMGLEETKNTFGRTLKVYGWESSSYYVIPLLGPSTVRDTVGMIPDTLFNPTWYLIPSAYISIGLFAINAIDTRAKYLEYDQLLNSTMDPYVTMRDTYMQSIGEPIPVSHVNDVNIDDLLDEGESASNKPTESTNTLNLTPTVESSLQQLNN